MVIAIAKKNPKKRSDRLEPMLIGILLVILLAAAGYSLLKVQSNAVAVVNGEKIREKELDSWYRLSVSDESVSKEKFLREVLIAQYILMQQAAKEGIVATDDEVDTLLGSYLAGAGMSLDEFSAQLEQKELSIESVRESFEVKATVYKLLRSKNYAVSIDKGNLILEEGAAQAYISQVIDSAQVQVLLEDEIVFEQLPGKCDDTLRLFVTKDCESCQTSSNIFKRVAKEQNLKAKLWVLDEGDDLMSEQIEQGIPSSELEYFSHSNKRVPSLVVGCSYQYIGSVREEHMQKAIGLGDEE